jgi:hypothetical protein
MNKVRPECSPWPYHPLSIMHSIRLRLTAELRSTLTGSDFPSASAPDPYGTLSERRKVGGRFSTQA